MYDGWVSVLLAYAITGGMFLLWFWMIARKLKRLSSREHAATSPKPLHVSS